MRSVSACLCRVKSDLALRSRRERGRGNCQPLVEEPSLECTIDRSRTYVSPHDPHPLLLSSTSKYLFCFDRNEGVFNSIVPGLVGSLQNSIHDWNYTSTPQTALNNRVMPLARGHILGGSSQISKFELCRFDSGKFDIYIPAPGRWTFLHPGILIRLRQVGKSNGRFRLVLEEHFTLHTQGLYQTVGLVAPADDGFPFTRPKSGQSRPMGTIPVVNLIQRYTTRMDSCLYPLLGHLSPSMQRSCKPAMS